MFTYVLTKEVNVEGNYFKVKVVSVGSEISPIGATMNDFACYLTDIMLKGWRVGDGNKTTVKSVVKIFADNGSSEFKIYERDYGSASWKDLQKVLPGFVKYMEYSAVQNYLARTGQTHPNFSSTILFNPDDNIPLLSVLRTMSPGKIKLVGTNASGSKTEFTGEILVSNVSADTGWETKPLPEEITKVAAKINVHVTRLEKEMNDSHEKLIKSLQKAVEDARSKEMAKQFKNLQKMFSAGWELKPIPDFGRDMYHMTKDIVVEYLEVPLKQITGRSIDSTSIVTIPLPPSYKKVMVIKDLIVDPTDKIQQAWAKGVSPHVSSGSSDSYSSVCIGDSGGKPISEISTLAESLRHVNIGSMFGNKASQMIGVLVESIKSEFAKSGEVILKDPKTGEVYGRLEISAGRLKGQKGTLFSTATAFTASSGESPVPIVVEDEGVWVD